MFRNGPSTILARDAMLLILTWAAGAVDAVSYLGLGHVFTAMMTGNTVLLGLALAQGELLAAGRSILALLGFALGVTVGATIDEACINALYMERTAKIMAIARLHGYQGPTAESIETQVQSRRKLFRRPRDEMFHSAEWNYFAHKIKQGERWTRGWT